MKIDLSDIAGTPGESGRYAIEERVAPTEEFTCLTPVTGEIRVQNAGSLLLVSGRLQVEIQLSCARCLAEYRRPIEIEVEEEFATGDTGPEVATIDRDEPREAAIYDYVLDVSELIRQQLLVHVPMAPLCRPDCRGICAHCGRNLNDGPCECPADATDSRWAELSALLEEDTANTKD